MSHSAESTGRAFDATAETSGNAGEPRIAVEGSAVEKVETASQGRVFVQGEAGDMTPSPGTIDDG